MTDIISLFSQAKDPQHNYVQDYYAADAAACEAELQSIPSITWLDSGQQKYLRLFHLAAERVPAYKDFLKKQKIQHTSIKSWQDFQQVPIMDKKNYLTAYPLPDLCWPGDFHRQQMISVSSGSSGQPFFWLRSSWQEYEATLMHELLFNKFFKITDRKTLLVVSFSMGMYVAGVLTQNCAVRIAQKNYPLTVVSPGISLAENVRIIKELAPLYEQVVLAGYPPFVKDIIDAGEAAGISWNDHQLRFIFAGEGFEENWRQTMLTRVGSSDSIFDSFSIYGSADANMLAQETPLTVRIRQLALKNNLVRDWVADEHQRLPGIFQYNPLGRYFEQAGSELVFSADNGIPLFRYNIHDTGRVIAYDELIAKQGIPNLTDDRDGAWQWPLLFLYGKDNVVIFYGLLIYPENIKGALLDPALQPQLTGRAAMQKHTDDSGDQYLHVHVELAAGIRPSNDLQRLISEKVLIHLQRTNLEYSKLHTYLGKRAVPEILLHEYGHFSRSGKQHWLNTM